jgi:hypothetical protein
MKLDDKKTIAREILLFFGSVLLSLVLVVGLFTRNFIIEFSISKKKNELNDITAELPDVYHDRISNIYSEFIEPIMIIRYKIGEDTICIEKEFNQDFLIDEYGIQKNLTPLPPSPTGFQNIKQKTVSVEEKSNVKTFIFSSEEDLGIKIKATYPWYAARQISNSELGNKVLEKYQAKLDTMVAIDFATLDAFRTLLNDTNYARVVFNVLFPRKAISSKQEFESILHEESDFSKRKDVAASLNRQITHLKSEIDDNERSILKEKQITEIMWNSWLMILVAIYPVRYLYKLIKWSIVTLKK